MKRLVSIAILLLLVVAKINAQEAKSEYAEKLTLVFKNDVKMVVESREILDIPQSEKVDNLVKNLLLDIGKVQDSLSKINAPIVITYKSVNETNRELSVNFRDKEKAAFIFTGNSDTVTTNLFNYTIECDLNNANKLYLYTNKLSGLSGLDRTQFSDLIKQVKDDVASRKISRSMVKSCGYNVDGAVINTKSADIKKRGLMIFSPGMDLGLSYINDRFSSSISFSLAYVFSQKSSTLWKVGVQCQSFYNMDPANSYMMQQNMFVDGFFNAKMPFHILYYATDLKFFTGYLVNRNGDLFPNHCWRFGFDMPAGDHFRIIYGIYMSGKEKGLFEVGIKYRFF